jgi:hypothetical protein
MPIIVYNRGKEDHSNHPYNIPIYRGGSVLGNPYTDKPLSKTKALYQVKTREEAIQRYGSYFDMQYGRNKEFTEIIDVIYDLYKNGETIYLECYCDPGKNGKHNCHGEVIVEKLQKRLLKEKINEIKKIRKNEVG